MIKKVISLILALIMCLNITTTASAAVINKPKENIANLIYFVNFKDSNYKFTSEKINKIKDMFDGSKSNSLSNYIKTISYDQMNVHNYFAQENNGQITPYTLPQNRSYYNKYNEHELISTVLSNVSVNKNYNIDMNKDGYVDNVIFIFGVNNGEDGDVLSAHKTNHNGATLVNGKKVDNYNVHNTYDLIDSIVSNEQGVLIHEFMHSIGYPDLYRSSGKGVPVWKWDIMASVSSFVQYPLAYLRSKVSSWISIDTITKSGTYTLKPTGNNGADQAFILKTPISEKEFFVVEYRKKGKPYSDEIDSMIPGDGLIIYRVNTEETSNYHGEKDYIYIFRPGETGEGVGDGDLSKAFLSKESGRITYGTDDFSKTIKDNAITYSNGQNSGIVIENVSSAGKEITFDVRFTDTTNLNIWDVVGNKEVSNRTNNDIDMDVVGDKVYTVYNEDYKLKAKMFDGQNWIQLGESIINKNGYNPTITVFNNIPYVLYYDNSNKYNSVVMKYINDKWQTVEVLTNDSSQYSDMISTKYGVYVAITTNSTENLKVLKLNQSINKFEQIGTNLHKGYIVEPSLSESDGKLYVSYTDFYSNNKVYVKKYENNVWKDIDGIDLSASRATIKAANNKLYLAMTLISGLNTSQLYVYENNKWNKVGDDIGGTEVGSLVLDINNKTPYVAYADNDKGYSIVKKLEDNKWKQEGLNVSDEVITKLDFKISNNKAYVAINPYTSQKLLIKSRPLEEVDIEDENHELNNIILYQTHIQDYGWQDWKSNGQMSGTSGESKRLEGIRINLGNELKNANIVYRTHIQDYGWQDWKSNGQMSGTSGESKRLEGIEIKLENASGYSVEYRTHVQDYGWQDWKSNGEMSGTSGQAKRLEAIEIRIVKDTTSDIQYRTHVQDYGWQDWKSNGEMSGTSGESKRLEGIEIKLENTPAGANIVYQTHVEDYGWQDWKSNGEMSGTSGESKRLEGIRIKLENAPGYKVEYRVHVEDYGWQDWKSDGEMAGTSGQAKRLEGIEVRVVKR